MLFASIIGIAAQFASAGAPAGAICPEPPPPAFGISGLGSCPQPNVFVFGFAVSVNAPITASLDCDYLGNGIGQCSAYPVEDTTSGMLGYVTTVTVAGVAEQFGTRDFQFSCPEGESATVDLRVNNGSAFDTETQVVSCHLPPVPGYVGGWSIGCPAGLPGKNTINIMPAAGVVDYYVVDLRGVSYGGGTWYRHYSGASPTPILSPQYESFVRVAACNLSGCGPLNNVGPRANPALCP